MSYSICFKCEKMVSRYEKYCVECSKYYHQDEEYWKRDGNYKKLGDKEIMTLELENDKIKPNTN